MPNQHRRLLCTWPPNRWCFAHCTLLGCLNGFTDIQCLSYGAAWLARRRGELCLGEPLLHRIPWHLAAPGEPNTLGVLVAAALPRLLPRGRAVSMREPAIASGTSSPWLLGTTGIGDAAVGAGGTGKRDSWMRRQEAPAGSVTAACGAPGVSIKGTPSGENVFEEKHSMWFPAKPTLWAAPPLRKMC